MPNPPPNRPRPGDGPQAAGEGDAGDRRDPTPPIPDAPYPPAPPPMPEVLRRPAADADRSGARSDQAKSMKAWGIGLNFAFSVMGLALIGWAVQTWWLKTAAPWPLLIGLGLGIVGGFVRFIREALAANRD